MEALLSLSTLRSQTELYVQVKSKLLKAHQDSERETELLDQIRAERNRLYSERAELIKLLTEVQNDIKTLETSEKISQDLKDSSSSDFSRIRDDEYEPLKKSLDLLRNKHGLLALPQIQQELDLAQSKYLQERLQRWTETGVIDRNDLKSSNLESNTELDDALSSPSHTPTTSGSTRKRKGNILIKPEEDSISKRKSRKRTTEPEETDKPNAIILSPTNRRPIIRKVRLKGPR